MAISRFDKTQPPGPRMSRCVVRDNTVYLAGLTASDATQDIKGQTKQILDKIDGYLAQAGTSKSNLLSANLWIKDMAMFADMNSVWNAWVDPENPPARACVRADLARPEVLVEIMVTAAKKKNRHFTAEVAEDLQGTRCKQALRPPRFLRVLCGEQFILICSTGAEVRSSRSRHRRYARPRAPGSTG